MKHREPVRLVDEVSPAELAAPDTPVTVIVTSEPHLFALLQQGPLAPSYKVFDNAPLMLAQLPKLNCTCFVFDYLRELGAKWTGHRLLLALRTHVDHATVPVWLMADQWQPYQEQWERKCGATGLMRRTAEAVLALRPQPTPAQESKDLPPAVIRQLEPVEATFKRFAGPLSRLHIEQAREALRGGAIEATRAAYIDHLADKLTLASQRKSFLSATTGDAKAKEKDITSVGDPWMNSVNALVQKYAGGIGARLFTAGALAEIEAAGALDRHAYVAAIARRFTSTEQRYAFLDALRNANLTE